MEKINPQFITNNKGKKISVVLPIETFNSMVEELEELYEIKLFDEASSRKTEFVDAKSAFEEIEKNRGRES